MKLLTMKLLLDNLFFLGEVLSLAGVAWGAGLVLRQSLCGTVFPVGTCSVPARSLVVSLAHSFRRIARV